MLKFDDAGRHVLATELGPVGWAWSPRGVGRLIIGPADAGAVALRLADAAPELPEVRRPRGTAAEVVRRLRAHAKGGGDHFRDVPVDLTDRTPFARKVLGALRRVGPGRVITYGELAARAGRPGGTRAVGRIMGANPVPLIVPCHRCLGADGLLTGFTSEGGIRLKARILDREGYVFDAGHEQGRRHLMAADPVMRGIIPRVGPYLPRPGKPRPAWDTLVRAIIHQQLSVKAGRTIAGRVAALTPGERFPAPEVILATADATLRAAGLSRAKVSYVKDLAARVGDGRLRLDRLRRLDDAAAMAALMEVRGIGEWSAQMHLMFHLDRLDIVPTGDVGLQNAAARAYGRGDSLTPAELGELADRWRPYRSLASWYLWQILDMGGL